MISKLSNNPAFYFTPYKNHSIEEVKSSLQNYKNETKSEILFIDILEKVFIKASTQEKLQLKTDGQLLLNKVYNEIEKLKSISSYLEDNTLQNKNKEIFKINKDIISLKKELSLEKNFNKQIDIKIKISELEAKLLSFF